MPRQTAIRSCSAASARMPITRRSTKSGDTTQSLISHRSPCSPKQPMVLNTRKDFPANNLPEFIDYVQKNSAKLQFGSAGAGTTTHLGCALLNAVVGVNVTHVPYRGGGPAANDLIGGQIDYMCLNMGSVGPLTMGKQVKAIATLSRNRSPLMPDLPTAQEQGLADFDVVTWNAFFLPKGAPLEVVKKLNDATSQAIDTPV